MGSFLSTFKIPLQRQTAVSGSTKSSLTSPCPCRPLSPEVFITPQSSIETRHYVTPQTSLDVNCLPTVISEEDIFSAGFKRNKTNNLQTTKSTFSDFNLSQLSLNSRDDNELDEDNEEKVKKKKKKKKSDAKGSLQKKNKKWIFSTPPRPPPPPLKCGNTFLGEKIFLQFHPENDLPTHKNWIK